MQPSSRFPTMRGFTLVELVIVILILGIIAAISLPAIGNSVTSYRAELAASRLAADLRYGSTRARATSSMITIIFQVTTGTDGGGYSFEVITDPQRPHKPLSVPFGVAPYAVQLDQTPDSISFDVFGYPDRDATWVINAATDSQRTVTIEKSSGRISIQ